MMPVGIIISASPAHLLIFGVTKILLTMEIHRTKQSYKLNLQNQILFISTAVSSFTDIEKTQKFK